MYVVDINMPKLDGYGFLRELRGQDIPAGTCHHDFDRGGLPSDQKQAFAAGANAYMVKPSKPDEIC
jgi:two-component system chemotaxis response regulator CheY